MSKLANVFIQGIIAFTVTNIDDMMILLLLFSQSDSNFRKRHIFTGQYLGFFNHYYIEFTRIFWRFIHTARMVGIIRNITHNYGHETTN